MNEASAKALATVLVNKFSIGKVTFMSIGAETYNAITGATSRATTNLLVEAAWIAFEEEKALTYGTYKAALVIAGESLGTTKPKRGDKILNTKGNTYIINEVTYDQYGAAYYLYTDQIAWA